jgi:hypothetical protein
MVKRIIDFSLPYLAYLVGSQHGVKKLKAKYYETEVYHLYPG